jgi:trans-aconitate 2-methyltransferase
VVYGIDNSQETLAQASAEPSRIRGVDADVCTWSPDEPTDLIYSNATLHWVEEHELT